MQGRLLVGLFITGGIAALCISYAMTRPQGSYQDVAPPSGKILGRVVDAQGQPVSGAKVHAQKSDFTMGRLPTAYTDNHGKFLIKGLTLGTYMMSVAKEEDGYPPSDSPFHSAGLIEIPQVAINEQQVAPKIVIQMGPRASRLVGHIVNAANKPIENAQITLSRVDRPDYSYLTGPDLKGKFKVLVPPVPIMIKVSAPGYEDWYYGGDGSIEQASVMRLAPKTTKKLAISLRPKLDK